MRDQLRREWEGFGGTECRQNIAEPTNGAGMAGPWNGAKVRKLALVPRRV